MKNDDVYLAVSIMALIFMGVILIGIFACVACLPVAKIIRQIGTFFDARENGISLFPTNTKNIGNAATLAMKGVKTFQGVPVRPTTFVSFFYYFVKIKKKKKRFFYNYGFWAQGNIFRSNAKLVHTHTPHSHCSHGDKP